MKPETTRNIIEDYRTLKIYESLSAAESYYLPKITESQGRQIQIINNTSYTVSVYPFGTELINDWNKAFPITEKGGILQLTALSDRWLCTPLNDACIYEVSSETVDSGLAVDGTWDDVSGMTLLNGVYGKGDLYARGVQFVGDNTAPQYITSLWGIGKTSGDNAPDIFGGIYNYFRLYLASANTHYQQTIPRELSKFEYESDGSTIYMKAKCNSDESPLNDHSMFGATDCPMYIKWIRRY